MRLSRMIKRGRDLAEWRMLDSCDVGTFEEAVDPVTFETIKTLVNEQYSGKCRVSSDSNAVAEREAGTQTFADQSLVLSVPVSAGGSIRTDAEMVYTAADPDTGNPAMVGRRYRIAGLANGSQATAARFILEFLS